MIKKEGNFPFYRFRHFSECPGLVHFVSSGEKNIGFSGETDSRLIRENRLALADAVGFPPESWVTAHQVHSANVTVVTGKEAGRGSMDKESRLPDTDALITNEPGVCLMVLSADCVPVLLYDPVRKVVAAVHAGWRGTVAQIVVRTVTAMVEQFGCYPADIRAGIGPSIGKCCFEVGEEVATHFRGLFPGNERIVSVGEKAGKYQVDLWEANRQELLGAGLMAGHIEVAGMCSVCHPEHFFSYRRDGKSAGRFGAGIMLCYP